MKLKSCFLIGSVWSHGVMQDFYDPSRIDSMQEMFKTTAEHPSVIPLNGTKPIPAWINGNFYRDGPGIFEWGEDQYKHFFDPTALLQRIGFQDGKVTYNSQYVKGRNYRSNLEANAITRPEVGTWAEPKWVDFDDNGNEYSEIRKKVHRGMMIKTNDAITDNTIVMAHPVHGLLLSMTETPFMNFHDPETLDMVGAVDIRKCINYPASKFEGTFQTAHGLFDSRGDFWNVMGGMWKFMGVPYKTVYVPYKIPNAKSQKRLTVDEIMGLIEFGEPTSNLSPVDLDCHWFHQAMVTENYLVLPLTSIAMGTSKVLKLILSGEPIVEAMAYHPDQKAEFRIFNKHEMKWEENIFTTDPMVNIHHINAYEENSKIIFDTMVASNGDTISLFEYTNLNATGPILMEQFKKVAPVGTATRFVLDLDDKKGHVQAEVMKFPRDNQWEAYIKNGHEFPIINFWNYMGKPYDHFWSTGFGSFLPDRIYHTHISKRERYVWYEDGYSPSEPVFCSHPDPLNESDGVLMSLVSPLKDQDLKPFVVVLNGHTLKEISRFYLPEFVHVPVGFHSNWLPRESRYKKKHSYYPHL